MFKHRIAFTGTWIVLLLALAAFPGSEMKGLMMGLIVGWWTLYLIHHNPALAVAGLVLSCGAIVGLCAWAMDAAGLTKRTWIVLLLLVAAGAVATYALNDYSFEAWKQSPAVSAAIEVSYEPTRWDYHARILIPKVLAGGMWGLYLAAALGFLHSIAVLLLRKRGSAPQIQSA